MSRTPPGHGKRWILLTTDMKGLLETCGFESVCDRLLNWVKEEVSVDQSLVPTQRISEMRDAQSYFMFKPKLMSVYVTLQFLCIALLSCLHFVC